MPDATPGLYHNEFRLTKENSGIETSGGSGRGVPLESVVWTRRASWPDPVMLPPEVGDLLHHRGRTRDQPSPVAGVVALDVVPGRLVEPGWGLLFPEDGLEGILDHDQLHAVDDPDH